MDSAGLVGVTEGQACDGVGLGCVMCGCREDVDDEGVGLHDSPRSSLASMTKGLACSCDGDVIKQWQIWGCHF
ncbi:hypothetical protein TIFTF001_023221 [Ficus carica]|uniref:Uncharacterized protein n=1 Tax=Ficus carica TaxID=3494 RepID=A0AA88DK51_FICCA|nr:hypothetical protein TIFTF001_023221 [Ficus carica]